MKIDSCIRYFTVEQCDIDFLIDVKCLLNRIGTYLGSTEQLPDYDFERDPFSFMNGDDYSTIGVDTLYFEEVGFQKTRVYVVDGESIDIYEVDMDKENLIRLFSGVLVVTPYKDYIVFKSPDGTVEVWSSDDEPVFYSGDPKFRTFINELEKEEDKLEVYTLEESL